MELKQQKLKIIEDNLFSISLFSTNEAFDLKNFIKSKSFIHDMKIEKIKEGKDKNHLQPLFIPNELLENDFKFYDKESISQYLDEFSNTEDWFDDEKPFKELLSVFKLKILPTIENGCYLIDKDWFKRDSLKVRDLEYDIYSYYLLVIWYSSNKVYTCEFFSD